MARKPRVDVPGAVYHVTARGNHQQRIFNTAEDYRLYLSLLREAIPVRAARAGLRAATQPRAPAVPACAGPARQGDAPRAAPVRGPP